MRLDGFRIQNYKKIRDTGWVSCKDLTGFVGINEAGKSAIFRGLSKLNPSDGEPYDGLKEFPRKRYTDEFASQDWPVATARFVLDDAEQKALTAAAPPLGHVKRAEVTRRYSGKYNVGFDPAPRITEVRSPELRQAIDQAMEQIQELTGPEGKGEATGAIKQAVAAALQQAKAGAPGDGVITKAQADAAVGAVAGQANEDWSKKMLDPIGAPLRKLSQSADESAKAAAGRQWVVNNLPKFIYFDNYDVIDSAVHLPTFVQMIATSPNAPKVRTTQALFKHVGLNEGTVAALGRHQPGQALDESIRRQIDERAILAASASSAMTQKFGDWWGQGQRKFEYQFDGDYFRIWVSDDVDESPIELDQRSRGMQYFFSFYTVFLVEAAGAHANSVLLLDEPGLYLHGTAQEKAVKFLEKLSQRNQVFYSTHSPFMVDVDHLERARAVYQADDGTTKVSEDVWPRDRDSLFPLQAALGYQVAQGLFVSKRQVVVEGLTDLWLLKALDQALAVTNRERLRQDVIITPSAGVTKLLPLASMLIGHKVELAALLDGDEPARREGKKLVEHLLDYEDRKCLFIGDFVGVNEAEIEDVFPEAEYLAAVKAAYPDVSLDFSKEEKALPGVVNRIQALFKRKAVGRFDKWKPAAVFRDKIIDAPEKVASSTLDVIEKINHTLNGLFGP